MATRHDWAWQPDETTLKAIQSGNNKMRRASRGEKVSTHQLSTKENFMATKKKASKKKVAAKKTAPKKKIDGKALAAKRKRGDSVAQFIKDELSAGRKDVDKILEKAKVDFPKAKPTRGYVRWIAKGMGLSDQVASERAAPKAPKEKKAKAKKKASKPDAPAVKPESADKVDPAS